MGEKLMSYEEVADLLNVPVGTVYGLVSQRRIPFVRLGGRLVRFRPSSIDRWVTDLSVPPPTSTPKGEQHSKEDENE